VRRIVFGLTVVALAVTACQDVQQPTANFQVSDGSAFGGRANPHFYFLPPLVPSPDFDGTFDPNLLPYLSVQVSGPFDDDGVAVCSSSPAFTFGAADGLEVDAVNQRYSFSWNTPKSLRRDKVYRLCVVLDVPGAVADTLGFRDVSPTQGGGSVAEDPVYLFNLGSNLAVKFRVELGVLTPALCTGGTPGQDYDCTAQFLGSNETALCDNATCLLTTGVMDAPELWRIEKFGMDNPACFNALDPNDPDSAVAGFPLAMDIPQYAGCVRVTLFDQDQSFDGFVNSYGTVGACFYPGSGSPVKISEGQDEAIQMHIQYPESGPVIWALPWGSTGGIVEQCELAETQPAASTIGGQIGAAAKKLWQRAQLALDPWFAPPKVYAFHTGFGGHTTLSSTEDALSSPSLSATSLVRAGSNVAVEGVTIAPMQMNDGTRVFRLVWALPSQMAASTFCAGTSCTGLATSPLRANPGEPVTLAIRVTDNGAVADELAFGGRSLSGTPRGVEGATVHFSDTDGGSDTQRSNDGGYVTYSFTPNGEGTHTVTASGFGIGTTDGPFDSFDESGYTGLASLLAQGTLSFDVKVCTPAPTADGIIANPEAGYYAGRTWDPVEVNLGGSKTGTAYLLVTNDCDDLYIAFMVPGDVSNTTSLRFVFDNTPTGSSLGSLSFAESADDDILSMTLLSTGLTFQDRYLSAACLGSKQADCGPLDTRQDGSGGAALNGFTFKSVTGWYVYEMKHPLKRQPGDTAPFQDWDRDPGQFLGYYLALYLGNGTKANAEYPRQNGNFKSYLGYQIQ